MNNNLIRIIPLLFTLVAIYNHSFAINSANCSNPKTSLDVVTDFDEGEIYNAFSEINDLISYISVNDSVTSSDIQSENNSLLSLMQNESAVPVDQNEKFLFNKQLAFLSGCVFGPNWYSPGCCNQQK